MARNNTHLPGLCGPVRVRDTQRQFVWPQSPYHDDRAPSTWGLIRALFFGPSDPGLVVQTKSTRLCDISSYHCPWCGFNRMNQYGGLLLAEQCSRFSRFRAADVYAQARPNPGLKMPQPPRSVYANIPCDRYGHDYLGGILHRQEIHGYATEYQPQYERCISCDGVFARVRLI
jgi:hypothetical protein